MTSPTLRAGDDFLRENRDLSLVLGGPLFQLLRRARLSDEGGGSGGVPTLESLSLSLSYCLYWHIRRQSSFSPLQCDCKFRSTAPLTSAFQVSDKSSPRNHAKSLIKKANLGPRRIAGPTGGLHIVRDWYANRSA